MILLRNVITARHQLKIKSSSKLDFLTNCILLAFTKENSSSPSLGSFLKKFFSTGHPSLALYRACLSLSYRSPGWDTPGPKSQEIASPPTSVFQRACPFRNYIQLDISQKRHVLNAASSILSYLGKYHVGLICATPFTKTFILKEFCSRGKKQKEFKLLTARTD